ncbi:MAG TPA: hypothetical protein VF692_08445 [Pyrinomonadaceae bacterium]|jgi:hypothetical protein
MKEENAEITEQIPATDVIDSEPTAKLIIKGLPFLVFSRKNNRAELGFLDVEEHDLLIYINEDLIPIKINRGSTIEINPHNPGIGKVFRRPGDDHDFGLVIDLNKHHTGPIKIRKPYNYFAKMYINSATFYTKVKSIFDAELQQINGNVKKRLSKVGKVGGANIYDKNFAILIDGKPLNLTAYEAPYEITVQYQCPIKTATRESDFHHIYDTVETADGMKFQLVYDGEEPPSLSMNEVKSINNVLEQIQTFFLANEKGEAEATLNRDHFLTELDYVIKRTSCEVACQVVTVSQPGEIEPD